MKKKILLISRHAPYGQSIGKEAIDVALAAAVYDQNLSILFMDDGVFQLLKDQNAENIAQKNFASMLSALPFYDIENIYVHFESLEQRNIKPDELVIEDLQILNSLQVNLLMSQQEHILGF